MEGNYKAGKFQLYPIPSHHMGLAVFREINGRRNGRQEALNFLIVTGELDMCIIPSRSGGK